MTITVIIPTYNRPDCIRTNLQRLSAQDPRPEQVIVVDASLDDRTEQVVREFLEVVYLRNPAGRGNTPNSRNMALLEATGDVIAFLDDDAFVRRGWSQAVLESYADPTVAGVAGRALNGIPGEEQITTDDIGRLRVDGRMTGNFNSDPGRVVEVDHMIGCNMSMRREVIAEVGGFRDDFRAGPFGICEETEICIRARRLGYRFIFNPAVCADHIGAPQPGGRRFSPKYSYYHAKNNLVMVVRNYGLGGMAIRHISSVEFEGMTDAARKIGGAIARLACTIAGLGVGLVTGTRLLLSTSKDPVRRDEKGERITNSLRNPVEGIPVQKSVR